MLRLKNVNKIYHTTEVETYATKVTNLRPLFRAEIVWPGCQWLPAGPA